MTDYTKGPWSLNNYGEPVDANGDNIRAKGLALTNSEEAKANSTLIASAPEMLEALKLAKGWLELWESTERELGIINGVIAKAEGRSK